MLFASPTQAQTNVVGAWSAPIEMQYEGVHAAILPSGKMLYVPDRDTVQTQIFDPLNPTNVIIRSTGVDSMFCGAHAALADGTQLLMGGAQFEPGVNALNDAYAFNWQTEQYTQLPNMNRIRWYPSTIIHGDGTIWVYGGTSLGGGANKDNTIEFYDPDTNTWTMAGGQNIPNQIYEAYIRIHLMPDGKVFKSGAHQTASMYDPVARTWTTIDNTNRNSPRNDGISIRLHDGRIMIAGGVNIHVEQPPTATAEIIDLTQPSPTWQNIASMNEARLEINGVLLPDGNVIVVGGNQGQYGTVQKSPELYNPDTNTWTYMATHQNERGYHSTSVLLPDGRVISSGGTIAGDPVDPFAKQFDIWSPYYLFKSPRPVINTLNTTANYGQQLTMTYSSANPVTNVVIRRPGSATHSFYYDQISVPVNLDSDNGSTATFTVTSNSNIFPPGYYLVFLMNNDGVPSVAKWLQIGAGGGSETDPPTPNPATFSAPPSALSDTQITMTATVASDATPPVEYNFNHVSGSPGGTDSGWQISTSYTDSGLTASTQYCYTVQSRDSLGNTGTASSSACATTITPDTDPPTPNPATFSAPPTAIGDSIIGMTATTATDAHPVISYQFVETTGNTGGTSSPWQGDPQYYDIVLNAGTQYCYTVQYRDGLGNTGQASSPICTTTGPEDGHADITVGPGRKFEPADVTINVGQSVEWTFLEGGHNVWGGLTGNHNYFINNPSQVVFASSGDPLVTNPAGFTYLATFDQAFLDNSTGDGTSANVYNFHCHIHQSGPAFFMQGSVTVNGGVDTAPPFPSPMTFASAPNATSSTDITMTATTAVDGQNGPVEYFFTELTGNPGGNNSTWQAGTNYTDTGLTPLTLYSYNVAARDSLGNTTTASAAANATTPDVPSSNILLETGVVSGVGSSWTTVNLGSSYSSMIVVATPNYTNSSSPGTVRIQNASGSSFQVRLDGSPNTPASSDIYYMVVEEGVYTQGTDGVKMEAVKFNSTITANNNNWSAHARTYANSYTSPVVVGQVMTYNDAGHVEFWSRGSSRQNPPSSSALQVGKTVNEDPDNAHANETIGYIVIDAGNGTIDGIEYAAGVTSDGVAGVTNNPPYGRPISGLTTTATLGVATLTAMDGGNGGWAMLYGANPISNSNINLAIDEDQLNDTERNHTGEQVAYIVFGQQVGGDTTAPTPNPATFASAPAATGSSSIAMTATTASDPSGPVEYNFDNTSGGAGGTDSGWQTSTSYTDNGLSASTQYCYTVQSRDSVGNTGTASGASCATTQAGGDTTPPTPNPATFASAPAATSSTTIAMTATTGSDPSGPVEYFFTETSGNPGGSNSAWQTSTGYTDTVLTPSTQYCYTVTSRDSLGNTGSSSAQSCATTNGLPDTNAPSSPSIASAVANSSSQITVTSTVSTDAEGSNPVEYQFNETTGGTGATDSGWQTSTTHVDSGLSASTQYCYQVRSRDSVGNTNSYSATSCATTQAGGGSWTKFDGNVANYTGTWETVTEYPAAYQGTTQWGLSGSFTYNFTGTGIRIFTWDCDGGTINLTIDGQSVGSINTTGACSTSVLKYENISLSPGSHTLVGTISSGEVEIDAFEVFN